MAVLSYTVTNILGLSTYSYVRLRHPDHRPATDTLYHVVTVLTGSLRVALRNHIT